MGSIPRSPLYTGLSVLVLSSLVLTGCGRGGGDGAAADDSSKGRIGFAQANFGNGWYEVQAQGVEDAAAKMGYSVSVVSGGGKPVDQNSQIQNFITQGVDAVIMNPTDPRAVAASVEALKAAGIPLVLVNTSLDPSLAGSAYCYVAEDEVENSRQIGIEMAQTLKDKYGAGSTVTFLMVEGFPGDSNSARREKGFNEGYASVADAPTLNTLTTVHGHFVADDAVAPVRSVATANPDLQAMFVVTDSMLPGVRTALEGAGMWGQVTIAGYDAQMAVVKQIRDDPDGPLVATVANSPYDQGRIGVEMVDKALDGVPQDQACPGGNHYLPPTLVTAANAAEYYRDDVDY